METLGQLTEEYLKDIIKFCSQFIHYIPGIKVSFPQLLEKTSTEEVGISRMVRKLQQTLGLVKGRSRTEDVRVRIDQVCEDIFRAILQEYRRKYGLRVKVYSEHGTYGDSNPQYLCAIDPFDGSGIFRRGLPKEWYSVVTFFSPDGEPLCGGSCDILQKEIYLALPDGVVRIPLKEEKEKGNRILIENGLTKVSPSRKRTLDAQTIIAAYLMNRDYRREWEERTKRLGDKFPALLVWPNGGACIYHHIASGEVHAYLMFREPRSEIDPGLAFAKAAPFPVFSVSEDGVLTPYQFTPRKQKERVPFFITACTAELAEKIVAEVLGK